MNVAVVALVSEFGPESIDVSGAVMSTTVKSRRAGVGSTLPVSSTARTSTRCRPRVGTSTSSGGSHDSHGPLSTRHSNSISSSWVWSSEPVNSSQLMKLAVVAGGPRVIVVLGGVTSGGSTTSHSYSVGTSGGSPKALIACTWKSWSPSSRCV